MQFITNSELSTKVKNSLLVQITADIDSPDNFIDNCELSAIEIIKDSLSKLYDIDVELSKTGAQRNERLKSWVLSLMCYYLYEQIPDNDLPAKIVKNYDSAIKEIKELEAGKRTTNLTVKTINNTPEKVFRWGSNPLKSQFK